MQGGDQRLHGVVEGMGSGQRHRCQESGHRSTALLAAETLQLHTFDAIQRFDAFVKRRHGYETSRDRLTFLTFPGLKFISQHVLSTLTASGVMSLEDEDYDKLQAELDAELAKLDPVELTWRDRQRFLQSKGYMLRPRYRPGWVPSWQNPQNFALRMEDSIRHPVSSASTRLR